ncbi:hypothetical protein ABT075_22160 [Streptomyces sp. NPDC002677]
MSEQQVRESLSSGPVAIKSPVKVAMLNVSGPSAPENRSAPT